MTENEERGAGLATSKRSKSKAQGKLQSPRSWPKFVSDLEGSEDFLGFGEVTAIANATRNLWYLKFEDRRMRNSPVILAPAQGVDDFSASAQLLGVFENPAYDHLMIPLSFELGAF